MRGRAAMSRGCPSPPPELVGKCLDLLKQAVPGVSRIAVLWQPGAAPEHTEKDILKEAEVAARTLGVQLNSLTCEGLRFRQGLLGHGQGARGRSYVLGSNMFFNERRRIVDLAAKNRLPAVYGLRESRCRRPYVLWTEPG